MIKTIQSSIKQAIFSRDFFIGLIGVIVVLFISSASDIFEVIHTEKAIANGFHKDFINSAIKSDAMILILPIVAALPYTASVVNDIKSGFIKYYLHRTSRNEYVVGKCIACFIAGGLVMTLGIILTYIVASVAFIPLEDAVAKDGKMFEFYIELLKKLGLLFLSGSFWSLCGLTLATLTKSKYMAYASPFIIYYILIILFERYFDKLYFIYPKEWINPSSQWLMGNFGAVILQVGLIIGISIIFLYTTRKRISQL